MHEQGMNSGIQQQEMLMMEMWDMLTDDQKKTLMKRMFDAKILMKEGVIKYFQFKIETFKMIKKCWMNAEERESGISWGDRYGVCYIEVSGESTG
jgi:hypothetical protein